uniref:C2 domain-containing protein n=1 Tax=Mastacembelus armatus TaxID=205130 RepID=A0A3Q3SMI5_9TELE
MIHPKQTHTPIPLELSRYMGKSEEDMFPSSKTSLSHNLHNNILTPDKIPEFCLPPRLCQRKPLLEADTTPPFLHGQNQIPKSSTYSNTTCVKTKDVKMKNGDALVAWQASKKPLPFSAEGYGLAGIYESPNTRRKESLFHSKCPVYMFDRSTSSAVPRLATLETNLPKKSLSGFLPLFSCKSLSETGSPESETPSSNDSSPLSSPYSAKTSLYIPLGSGRLKGATSCPSLIDNVEGRRRLKRGGLTERLQREHVLPLQRCGKVRLSAEHTTFSSLSTVRVRLVSVEGLRDGADHRSLNCAVKLCLMPRKLQQQRSATIRNCHSPVFNEDFFFSELSQKDLLELQLRLKVVDKHAAGTLRRDIVIGVITKPLSQLLPLKQREK